MCLLFSARGLYSHVLVSSQEQWQYLETSDEQSGIDILHMIKGNLLNAFGFWKVHNCQWRSLFICTCKDYQSVAFIRVCFHCTQIESSPFKGSNKK